MKANRIIICVTVLLAFGRVANMVAGDATNGIVRRLPVRLNPPAPQSLLPAGANSGANPAAIVVVPPTQVISQPATELPKTVIAWDSETKETTVAAGSPEARFTFSLTNISSSNIIITAVQTSCGCTVPHGLPQMPWTLVPQTNAQFDVAMNLLGKAGVVTKTVTVVTDHGNKTLLVNATIKPAPAAAMGDRQKNQQMALADRQAVFKGDCASCHVEPAKGKSDKDLYVAACGICHDAEHRASMVPDLHALNYPTGEEIWKNWTVHGKPGTLMPAFSIPEGGPLTDDQIASLVSYLTKAIPSRVAAQLPKSPPAAN